MILKPPKKWRQEVNKPGSNIMRRDKEAKEMLQETKESQVLCWFFHMGEKKNNTYLPS
jgi:hypothetical protein